MDSSLNFNNYDLIADLDPADFDVDGQNRCSKFEFKNIVILGMGFT